MASKKTSSAKIEPVSKKIVSSTPVRNSAIPKPAAKARKASVEITQDMIAAKAYEIYASGAGGSELDNWFAAERELRSGV
jgi:hypothetical protein